MKPADLLTLGRARRLAASGDARALRLAAGIRQNEAARSIGISQSLLNHWEAGRQAVSASQAGLEYGRFLDALLEGPR